MVGLQSLEKLCSRLDVLLYDATLRKDLAPCGESVVHLLEEALAFLAIDMVEKTSERATALVDLANESILLYHYSEVPEYWRRLLIDAGLLGAAVQWRRMILRQSEPFEALEPLGKQLIKDLDTAIVVSGAPGQGRREMSNAILDATQDWLSSHRANAKGVSDDDDLVLLTGHPSRVKILRPVTRLDTVPTVAWFEDYVSTEAATPFVIPPSALDDWPAFTTRPWRSGRYLLSVAADRVVPVEVGARYTDTDWHQCMMRFDDFVQRYIITQDGPPAYLAQHDLLHQIPRLRNDIDIPAYCHITPPVTPHYACAPADVLIHAWFGPRGTVSPLHHDPYHNLLAQVVGQKYIRLYAPDQTHRLYPHPGLMANTSQVDVEHPHHDVFPLFAETPYFECILEPGELLYIPPTWWHYVRSLDTSFSISFWF